MTPWASEVSSKIRVLSISPVMPIVDGEVGSCTKDNRLCVGDEGPLDGVLGSRGEWVRNPSMVVCPVLFSFLAGSGLGVGASVALVLIRLLEGLSSGLYAR